MTDRVRIDLTQEHLNGDARSVLQLTTGDVIEITFEQLDGSTTRIVTTVGVVEHVGARGDRSVGMRPLYQREQTRA